MRLAGLVLIMGLLPGLALAQERPIPPQVLEIFPSGEDACYAATFKSSRHRLSQFYLYRLFDPDPSSESIEPSRDEAVAEDRKAASNTTFVLARFSDSPHYYNQAVTCDLASDGGGRVSCYVECDGGSFLARQRPRGLEISVAPEGGLSLNQSCGEPDEIGRARWMTSEDVGGKFALQKSQPGICAEARRAAWSHDGGDPVPLRQRIAAEGWRCLKRRYEKAHLDTHPQQQVTSIALAIRQPPRTETAEEGGPPSTSLAVTLSITLRNGAKLQRDSTCWADATSYSCEGGFRLRRKDGKDAWLLAGEYEDPDRSKPPFILDRELGTDDRLFRLNASAEADCTAE